MHQHLELGDERAHGLLAGASRLDGHCGLRLAGHEAPRRGLPHHAEGTRTEHAAWGNAWLSAGAGPH